MQLTLTRTLADALKGADVFLGLSVKGAMTDEMVRDMADNPIIFAMADPTLRLRPKKLPPFATMRLSQRDGLIIPIR